MVSYKDFMSKLKFKMNSRDKGHFLAFKMLSSVALEVVMGRMILSGEDIAKTGCFLVRLVTGDDWQKDHGDNSHREMTRED
jgi:hypothetical protein